MTELRRLLGYMRPYVGRVVFASILLAIAGGLMAAVLGTFKPLVNEVFGVAGPAAASAAADSAASDASILSAAKRVLPLDRLASWARGRAYVEVPLVLLVLFFVRAVLLYGGQYVILKSGASVVRDIRADLYESIAFQSLRFYQAHPTGLILSRVLHDVSRLQGVATIGFVDFIRVASSVPFVVALVLWQDWKLATFSLVTLPALAVPMIRLSRRLRRAATRSQETMAEAASLLAETVGGARVVQAFFGHPQQHARAPRQMQQRAFGLLRTEPAVARFRAVNQMHAGRLFIREPGQGRMQRVRQRQRMIHRQTFTADRETQIDNVVRNLVFLCFLTFFLPQHNATSRRLSPESQPAEAEEKAASRRSSQSAGVS